MKLKYIESRINEIQNNIGERKKAKYKEFIQSMYMEDRRRCLRWYVIPNTTPECKIDPIEFENTYGETWNENKIITDNEEFNVKKILTERDNEDFINDIFDDELIERAIDSRSNIAAHGPDGISNFIWKLGKEYTIELIKITTKLVMSTGRCPNLLKRGKTVMIYKKGNSEDPHSWRPITITSTFYRMWMVVITRAMQSLNAKKRFLAKSQKGFLQTSNATLEHTVLLNELIQHVSRNKGSIYITTIDFADAFGSVPHDHIFKVLTKKGFNSQFINMIKATYNHATTKIIVPTRGNTNEIHINCGVKQGCPLSPLIFNLCIDPLLTSLEKSNIDGIHINGKSICAQAYADDLVLISDSERGMNNLIQKVERFCKTTKMKVNPSKCRSFSYINVNNNRSSAATEFKIDSKLRKWYPIFRCSNVPFKINQN